MSSLCLYSRTEVRFNSAFIHIWDSLPKSCFLGALLGQNHLSSKVLPYPVVFQERSRNATTSTRGAAWALTCCLSRPKQHGAEKAEGGSSGQQEQTDYEQDLQCNIGSPDRGLALLSNTRKFFHRTLSIIH